MDGAALGALAAPAPRSILLATTARPSSPALCGRRYCWGPQSTHTHTRTSQTAWAPPGAAPASPGTPPPLLDPLFTFCPFTTLNSLVLVAFQPGQVVREMLGYRGRTDPGFTPIVYDHASARLPRSGGEPGTGGCHPRFAPAGPGRVR